MAQDSTEYQTVHLRIPRDLHEWLKQYAQETHRSITNAGILILSEARSRTQLNNDEPEEHRDAVRTCRTHEV